MAVCAELPVTLGVPVTQSQNTLFQFRGSHATNPLINLVHILTLTEPTLAQPALYPL